MIMKTQKYFNSYNRLILQRIMESEEPTEADSFSDLNDDIINYSLSDHVI